MSRRSADRDTMPAVFLGHGNPMNAILLAPDRHVR
jgi:hypothetical protein